MMRVIRTQPQNLRESDIELFSRSAFFDVPSPVVAELKNVFVFWQGQVFNTYTVYAESICTELFLPRYGRLFFGRGLASAIIRNRIIRTNDRCLVVHDEWSGNYFHWLTDLLTRIYLVRNILHELTLIIPETFKSDYQDYTLKKFGVKKIIFTNPRMVVFAKHLTIPAHTAPAGNYHPVLLKRAVHILSHPIRSTGVFGDKIYISRSNAAVRKVTNEAQVQLTLEKLGFRILLTEDLHFSEAINIMRNAKILVSIHGAGLTNLMFMQPGSAVLELRREDSSEVYNTYFSLSSVFDILYYYMACKSSDGKPIQESDIHVDTDELEQVCSMMMEKVLQ